ncbi:MAG: DUF3786 domain-containing protein [Desulfobacterium sp.]
MKDIQGSKGHKKHHENLIERLKTEDISSLADRIGLQMTATGEAEIPFLGTRYLISNNGAYRSDGRNFSMITASALIHYLLKGSSMKPAGRFVSLTELSGPWLQEGSFSKSALESPVIKCFRGHVPALLSRAAVMGGNQGGSSGLGSISLIFDLLPNLPLQLIFYDMDEEFPARATLLLDANATEFIDFEALAFLTSIFVRNLTQA